MKTNNDPSTGSGTNKNQKIEELSDEQLKQVAGGINKRECPQKVVECHAIQDCKQQALCLENLRENGCSFTASVCVSRQY